jgi:hypothetical protein
MNLLALRITGPDRFARAHPVLSNLALAAFAVLLWSLAPEPQVGLAIALFVGSLAGSAAQLARRA